MKRTYVYVDGEFVERKKDAKGRYHYVMPDIVPYKSIRRQDGYLPLGTPTPPQGKQLH